MNRKQQISAHLQIRRKQLLAGRPASEKAFHKMLKAICAKYAEVIPQQPIGPYIVDFLVQRGKKKVVIEIDGGYHTAWEQHRVDIQKTDYFVGQRYSVWRLTPEAAAQLTRAEIAKELWRLLHVQNVTWNSDRDVEHPLDPAVQFKRYS